MSVRMRFPQQVLEELKKEDPNTQVSMRYIRWLANSGKIPVVEIGKRKLINYDAFLEYLKNPTPNNEGGTGKIRRIDK